MRFPRIPSGSPKTAMLMITRATSGRNDRIVKKASEAARSIPPAKSRSRPALARDAPRHAAFPLGSSVDSLSRNLGKASSLIRGKRHFEDRQSSGPRSFSRCRHVIG